MPTNRSVPADVILPHVVYQNVADAIDWLIKTFGFREHYRYGPPESPNGAQLHLGEAWIMLKQARPGWASPSQLGSATQSLTIFVDDVAAQFRKVQSAGAKIVEELQETLYGERQFAVEDLEGHHWLFSQHAHDLSPDEWGATVAKS